MCAASTSYASRVSTSWTSPESSISLSRCTSTSILGSLVAIASLLLAPGASAQADPVCVGDTESTEVERKPGPPLRFGIGPLVQTGQIGPTPAPAVPEHRAHRRGARATCGPADGPFVLRLNRFFWSDREAGVPALPRPRRALHATPATSSSCRCATTPTPRRRATSRAWTAHVREVVRRFGRDPRRGRAPDRQRGEHHLLEGLSSDGAYRDAREALVQGVIAAKDEAQAPARATRDRLQLGLPARPRDRDQLLAALRDRGGAAFVRSLDWIGLDAYPGTIFPPAETSIDGYRDGMVNAHERDPLLREAARASRARCR